MSHITQIGLPPSPRKRISRPFSPGFTLIEMMIVISIIMILTGIAVGVYQRSVLHTRETVLHQDLRVMREAIDGYTLDKQAAPQSLEDLASGDNKYLGAVPTDPITHQKDWRTDTCDFVISPEQNSTGICDVHSNSDAVSPIENTPYSSW